MASLKSLEKYLRSRPQQAITIQYFPEGCATIFKEDRRKWRAILKEPMGSKCGYMTDTLENLIEAIVKELP